MYSSGVQYDTLIDVDTACAKQLFHFVPFSVLFIQQHKQMYLFNVQKGFKLEQQEMYNTSVRK